MSKRINWIDILKAIAIFFVVLGHTLNGGLIEQYIYSFHIPLFFFLSGMFFKNDKVINTFKNKSKTLLIPYFVFGIISILVFLILGKYAVSSLGKGTYNSSFFVYFKELLYGSAYDGALKFNLPLWFLPCLFITSISYLLFYKVFKNKTQIIVPILFLIISILINNFISIPVLPFSINTAFTMIIFYSLGYSFKSNIKNIKFNKKTLICISIIFFIIGLVIGLYNGRIRYSVNVYNNMLLFFIGSISSIISYISISYLINKNKLLEYIGKNTLTILVVHKFPILFFQVVVPYTSKLLANNNIPISFIVALVSISLCLVFDLFVKKFCPIVIGQTKKS